MNMGVGHDNERFRGEWLERVLGSIPPKKRLLDAGAGEQQYRKFCSHLEYVSQDFGEYHAVDDGSGLHPSGWDTAATHLMCDIASIPEPDASFDVVLCTEVLEHLPDPIAAIKEFSRLLCAGGTLILTAPFCSLTHFSPYHFYSGFNRSFYTTHLENNGFEIVQLECNGSFFEFLAQEMRRLYNISLRYSNSRPNLLERLALRLVLRMLHRFSGNDKGSSELLCFGFHVLAKKICM